MRGTKTFEHFRFDGQPIVKVECNGDTGEGTITQSAAWGSVDDLRAAAAKVNEAADWLESEEPA